MVSNEIAFPPVSNKSFGLNIIIPGDKSTVTFLVDNPAQGILLNNFALTDNLPSRMNISPKHNGPSSS